VSIKLEAPDEQESGHLHAVMTFDKARAGVEREAIGDQLHRTHSDNCECLGMEGLFCWGRGPLGVHPGQESESGAKPCSFKDAPFRR